MIKLKKYGVALALVKATFKTGFVLGNGKKEILLTIDPLTDAEKDIIAKGCLINYYKG